MYQVVTEVLYHSPIVQNFGLFLEGIQRPLAPIKPRPRPEAPAPLTEKTKIGSLVEHKRHLLGKVRKLTLIHHSTMEDLEDLHMMSRGGRSHDVDLKYCYGDERAQDDIDGWKLVKELIRPMDQGLSGSIPFAYRNAFSRLESFSFGTWDDGRWMLYKQEDTKEYEEEEAMRMRFRTGLTYEEDLRIWGRYRYREAIQREGRMVSPSSVINSVLKKVFYDSHPIDICQNDQAGVNLKFGFESSLKVIHNAPLEVTAIPGRVRIYTTTKGLGVRLPRDIRIGNLRLNYNRQMKPFFRRSSWDSSLDDDSDSESGSVVDDLSTFIMENPLLPTDFPRPRSDPETVVRDLVTSMMQAYQAAPRQQGPSRIPPSLEICISPETPGDERQLQLALDIQEALRTYEEASQAKDGTNGYQGTIKIIVGEDIPPCPCCGGGR
jgi:hypothetical protein